jgi:hypothetical protein
VEADERLAGRVTTELLERLAAAIPDDWLVADERVEQPADPRAAYVAYLLERLRPPRAWVEEAERARRA